MSGLTVAEPGCRATRLAEMPRYRLYDILIEHGFEKIAHLGRIRGPQWADPFQRLLVEALLRDMAPLERPRWRARPVYAEEYRGRRMVFLAGRGDDKPDAVMGPGRWLRRLLLERLPSRPRPVFALDFSLLHRHSAEEARSLRVQVGATLGAVRRYLWDAHLLLAGLPPGGLEWLRGFLGSPLVASSTLPADEALQLRGYSRIILLDPSAEKPLEPSDVLGADAFILGAIVDRTPRPGETRRLRLRGVYEARRLELRGSIHGVPNRLNTLVEVLLRARYEFCGDAEKAILASMSPRDARQRAYVEISRWLRGSRRRVPWSLYCELRKWLPLGPRDFIRAARMAGGEPPSGEPPSSCSAAETSKEAQGTRPQ